VVEVFSETPNLLPISIMWWKWVGDILASKAGLSKRNISISFVSKKTISQFNKIYRGEDVPTDVLSFNLKEDQFPSTRNSNFGEIVICPEVVKSNANSFKETYTNELARVILHGLLHLKGYDHSVCFDGEKVFVDKMFKIQEDILKGASFDIFFPRVIVGLGNIGEKYENNPHNVGFMFIQRILEKVKKIKGGVLPQFRKCGAEITQICDNPQIVIAKPLGYMNKSGSAVSCLCKEIGIDPRESLLVIHDELDMRLGDWKWSFGASGKTHKGIKNIEAFLKTKRFWRFRVGIDTRKDRNVPGEVFVLSEFSGNDIREVSKVFDLFWAAIYKKIKVSGVSL